MVLIANDRIEKMYSRLWPERVAICVDIRAKQAYRNESYVQHLRVVDYLSAWIASVVLTYVWCIRRQELSNVLQCVFSYDWFLVAGFMRRIDGYSGNVFFGNHYDRWAYLIDNSFERARVSLIQHGMLDDNFVVPCKLRNVAFVYKIKGESDFNFANFINNKRLKFEEMPAGLNLMEPKLRCEKSVLIIGYPFDVDSEIVIANELVKRFDVFVKPHPVYSADGYSKLKPLVRVVAKDEFPRVDLALCYESTLGLEYEASGVPVLWRKGVSENEVIELVMQRM